MLPELPIEAFEIFATGIDHPECVAFDKAGDLWAGGEAGQIYRITPDRKVELIANLGGFSGGLAFSPNDELFVCNPLHGIVRMRNGTSSKPVGQTELQVARTLHNQTNVPPLPFIRGEGRGEGLLLCGGEGTSSAVSFSIFATHADGHKLICPNFGVFDSRRNYYVTDSGNFRNRNGFLIRFTPDGQGKQLAGPLGYANGLALSADERFLFMVESDTDSVLRFELGKDGEGVTGAPETYATECGRFPDGLALDAEGNLYVSCYASDEIWRINPRREKTLFAWDRWAILLGSPTNMAFGGKDFDEMYFANLARTTITRAKVGRKGQLLVNQR
jgi:gluconolactonase